MGQIAGLEFTICGMEEGQVLRNCLPWLSSKKDVLHLFWLQKEAYVVASAQSEELS